MMRNISDIDKINIKLYQLSNYYQNKVVFNNLNLRGKRLLEENKVYENKYKGKRCFVIGNGPSMNKIDFSVLSDDLVITVNNMFMHNDFVKLNSNFHFIADPYYFQMSRRNSKNLEIIEKMSQLSDYRTTLFCPLSSINICKSYGWNRKINMRYFESRLYFYDGYKEDIDFTKFIPAFQAVVQWAIAFAVYMGCSDIYLLGCDATNIPVNIALFVKKDTELAYAYNMSKEIADITRKDLTKAGLECTLYGYWRIVHLFSELSDYCKRKKVGLYNCSEESILECIPRCKFENIIDK